MWGDLIVAVNKDYMNVDKEEHVVIILTSTKVTLYQSNFKKLKDFPFFAHSYIMKHLINFLTYVNILKVIFLLQTMFKSAHCLLQSVFQPC